MTETQINLMRAVTGTIPDLKLLIAEIERATATEEKRDWQVHMLHERNAVVAIGNARWGSTWLL